MRKLFIRHELSEANNSNNWGTEAFGHPLASLMPEGIERTPAIGAELMSEKYGIYLPETRVAISGMLRTRHTAYFAGARKFKTYRYLDEIPLTYDEIMTGKATKTPPQKAIDYVAPILENPPEEEVIFTHGFVIATICYAKGLEFNNFIPKFGEIRSIELGDPTQ